MEMNKNGSPRRQVLDYAAAAIEQMKIYCAAHPGSPSAMRRPQLFFRSDLWIALLGPSLEEGIVGIGPTVAAALRAFDAQYSGQFAATRRCRSHGRSATPAPIATSRANFTIQSS
jgi:hypothetical protein